MTNPTRTALERAYDHGFSAGEAAGMIDVDRARDRGVGIGFLIGVGIGAALGVLLAGVL